MATKESSPKTKPNTVAEFLPFDLPYLTDELKKRARSELFEDEDTIYHSLKLLRSMLKDEKNLNFLDDDDFLKIFLRARKYDVKRAFNLSKTFYSVKIKHSELYQNISIDNVAKTLEHHSIGFLPYRDYEGSVIVVLLVERWNPHECPLSDIMRALTLALLHAISSPSTQVAGFKVIVDFKGLSLSKLPHITPGYLWLFAEALQNCFPARFRSLHVVNENYLFTYIWRIIKQFLSKKLTDRFHFHGKNVLKLQKYFSPKILPEEYGGHLPSFNNTEYIKQLKEYQDEIYHINSFGYVKPDKRRNSK